LSSVDETSDLLICRLSGFICITGPDTGRHWSAAGPALQFNQTRIVRPLVISNQACRTLFVDKRRDTLAITSWHGDYVLVDTRMIRLQR